MGEVKLYNPFLVNVKQYSFDGPLHKQLRVNKIKLSLREYAKLIKINIRQVSRYESINDGLYSDDHQIPTLNPFKRICLALQTDPKELMGLKWIDGSLIGINNASEINLDLIHLDLCNEVKFCPHCKRLIVDKETLK